MSELRDERVAVVSCDAAGDPCIALVRDALAARGAGLTVVDTSAFPAGGTMRLDARGARYGDVDLASMRALWLRHVWRGARLPEGMSDAHRDACDVQSAAALWSLLSCAEVFQLDPPEVMLSAVQKPRVSHMASRLGLDVPRSLVTNDPEAVRAFARELRAPMICKMVESGAVSLRDADGARRVFPTLALTDGDLDDLDGLSLAPMIFQERVEKSLEVRVTVVGREMFVAAVDPRGAVDARTDPSLVRGFRAYDAMPAAVRARLFALLDQLGQNFATIDLLVTPDRRWVFLEVNTVSFFDHIERYAGLPISGAIADLLLGRAMPRVHHPDRPFWEATS